jgi:Fe-S cluster biogenesis protein NfuA
VIMNKRDGDRAAHARFFGRLSELVVSFVRTGTGNFQVTGPTDFPWQEFSTKMSFVPGQSQAFRQFVLGINPTPGLVDGLMDLAILHPQRDAALAEDLRSGRLEAASVQLDLSGERANGGGRTYVDLINDALLSTEEKVKLVIEGYIQPVLDNDGGAVDYLGFDPARGEVSVRFLGSCANCPASILSVETLVKPPLLNIPGVHRVTHRTRLRKDDEKRVETVRQSRLAIALE